MSEDMGMKHGSNWMMAVALAPFLMVACGGGGGAITVSFGLNTPKEVNEITSVTVAT